MPSDSPDAWYYFLLDRNVKYVIFGNETDIATVPWNKKLKNGLSSVTAARLADASRFANVFFDAREETAIFKVTPPQGFMADYREMLAAQLIFMQGKKGEALDKLLALDKKHAPLKRLDFVLGSSLLLDGQGKKALPYLERAAALEPDFPLAAQRLAQAKKA